MLRGPQFAGIFVVAALTLTGCTGGHGKYTQEGLDQADLRHKKLKAAADYDLAFQQFTSGNLDLALASVDRSLANYDRVPNAHILRARVLLEKGISVAALDSLDKASRIDPADAEIEYYKGVVYERINELDSALSHYQTALGKDTSNPKYGLVTAEILIGLHRFAEARDLLETAHGDAGSQAGYKQALGHIDLMEKKPEEALKHFEQAVALDPDDASLLEDLARIHAQLGHYSQAESALAKVLTTPPNDQRRDLQLLRASCLIELRRPVEARALLLALTKDSTQAEDVEALLKLVDVGAMLEDESVLRYASARLIALAPNRPEGYIAAALVQRRAGDIQGALANTNIALAKKPDDRAAASLKKLLEKP